MLEIILFLIKRVFISFCCYDSDLGDVVYFFICSIGKFSVVFFFDFIYFLDEGEYIVLFRGFYLEFGYCFNYY